MIRKNKTKKRLTSVWFCEEMSENCEETRKKRLEKWNCKETRKKAPENEKVRRNDGKENAEIISAVGSSNFIHGG